MAYSQPEEHLLEVEGHHFVESNNSRSRSTFHNLISRDEQGHKESPELDQSNLSTSVNSDKDKMETFFARRKSDTMFELRNIQHGERPVTGQNYRDNIQQFMKKHLTSIDERTGKENVPANVDDVEEHRPDSVVVEVQGIIEQRPVSSILQSAAFRRHLENVIRGSIAGVSNDRPSGQRPQPRRNNIPTPRMPVRRPERTRIERSESSDSISSQDSFSSARSSVDQDINDFDSEPHAQIHREPRPPVTPRTTLSSQPSQVEPPQRRQNLPSSQPPQAETQRIQNLPPQAEESSQADPDIAVGELTWNDVSRVHREELVQELSELVHTRLVSSTLEGEFRATLELLVQDRLTTTGTDGEAVREAVRSLPGRGIPRNDFSHLGIPPALDNDNWDNISVTSVSAHSVPYTQTNSYLSREIQGLKNQLKEMKNMFKISVDLQMDVQRAIKQEVAAALAQSAAQGACVAPTPPSRPVNDTHCLICLEKYADSVLYQCGHMCVCFLCGKNLVSQYHTCPVCRAPIKDVVRAFKTNFE